MNIFKFLKRKPSLKQVLKKQAEETEALKQMGVIKIGRG